ncbi:MAG: hypothetical protein IKH13_06810 [Clostridia bacterium]|nr:hypothetical protein [Clostridia bacterium]
MTGRIIQINGSVVDVLFPDGKMPKINEALSVNIGAQSLPPARYY